MTMPRVNEQAIQKAVMNLAALSGGGRLNPAQSSAFIRMIQDQPTIMKEARTIQMTTPSMKIEKIGFGQRVLAPGEEGKDIGEDKYVAPTTGTVKLETKEFVAVVKITDDTLESNIEGNSIEDTIMAILAERAALDMEELILNGDTASTDKFLAQLDGIRKQVTSHVVDQASKPLDKLMFKNAKKTLPAKYLRNPADWRFYVSYDAETDWTDLVGERNTIAGDEALISGSVKPAYGIPVKGIAMLQEYNNGSGVDVTDALLTNPKNIVVGISRDIRIEPERKARERATYIVLTVKLDVQLEEKDAAVKISKIKA